MVRVGGLEFCTLLLLSWCDSVLTKKSACAQGNLKDRLGDFLGSGIFLSDGDAWRRHRKIASSEFSTRKIREHSSTVFREDAVQLANILNIAMAADEPVEFQVQISLSHS